MIRRNYNLLAKQCLLWVLIFLSVPIGVYAADGEEEDESPKAVRFLKKVGTLLDSMAIRGRDRRYVELPKKPWQVIVQGSVNQSDLKMSTTIDGKSIFSDDFGDIYWESQLQTRISSYAGVWVGYRGYGIGYSTALGHHEGSLLKFGAIGGSYGVNLRISRFETNEPSIRLSGYMPDWQEDYIPNYTLDKPIRVRTMTLDGYYLFNSKRYSYSAAYDQTLIQKRSAGSLMAGAVYYHSSVAYDNDLDADFIMFMDDIGTIKQSQLNIGAGYTYNFVPCKGLLINAMLMPMVSVFNQVKVWYFHSGLRDRLYEQQQNPSGTTDDVPFDELYKIRFMGTESENSRMRVNVDARLSVTYNFGNWFVNAYGQFCNFRYRFENSHGRLHDWYINASVGLRL